MKTSEIKKSLLSGINFQNDSANWFTLCKPSSNRFILVKNDKYISFINVDRLAKKISELLKNGF